MLNFEVKIIFVAIMVFIGENAHANPSWRFWKQKDKKKQQVTLPSELNLQKQHTLGDLPQELKEEIFSHLNLFDLSNTRLVNRNFNQLGQGYFVDRHALRNTILEDQISVQSHTVNYRNRFAEVPAFSISKSVVTRKLWKKIMGEDIDFGPCLIYAESAYMSTWDSNDSKWLKEKSKFLEKFENDWKAPNAPATCMKQSDIPIFTAQLSKRLGFEVRLPTEPELKIAKHLYRDQFNRVAPNKKWESKGDQLYFYPGYFKKRVEWFANLIPSPIDQYPEIRVRYEFNSELVLGPTLRVLIHNDPIEHTNNPDQTQNYLRIFQSDSDGWNSFVLSVGNMSIPIHDASKIPGLPETQVFAPRSFRLVISTENAELDWATQNTSLGEAIKLYDIRNLSFQ